MLRHVVLFRRKPGLERDEVLERSLFARMRGLGSQIAAIQSWRVAANELQRPPMTWDLILESEVVDAAALDAYLLHPQHQALVQDLRTYYEWAAVDYTV